MILVFQLIISEFRHVMMNIHLRMTDSRDDSQLPIRRRGSSGVAFSQTEQLPVVGDGGDGSRSLKSFGSLAGGYPDGWDAGRLPRRDPWPSHHHPMSAPA